MQAKRMVNLTEDEASAIEALRECDRATLGDVADDIVLDAEGSEARANEWEAKFGEKASPHPRMRATTRRAIVRLLRAVMASGEATAEVDRG